MTIPSITRLSAQIVSFLALFMFLVPPGGTEASEGQAEPQQAEGYLSPRSTASRSSTTEQILSRIAQEVADKVSSTMKQHAGLSSMTARMAVISAVPLSDLKHETEFGRMVAEYYLTDLADRGLQVQELRLGKDIHILPQSGEFILSQNAGELANDTLSLDYVIVSTFSNTKKTLILQGRMVSLQTGVIITSWRHTLPLTHELITLLDTPPPPFTMAVKGL